MSEGLEQKVTAHPVKEVQITDDLKDLLAVMPPRVRKPLEQIEDTSGLLEVVLDLGRKPEARFLDRETELDDKETAQADIEYLVSRIGEFTADNRAGIPRTLHRISAIRNRKGDIVGLTCRIGRAVYGTIEIIRDLVETGQSLLLLGRPGVGKTTLLRDVARVLADDLHKRVIVVDTSNEIAGDGDIPHGGIGRARRMQVPNVTDQHKVMIEAVENHMPEVIIVDEIGTELEAAAARTIAERGVQLVGTAHGNSLNNLMQNPTLSDLVGGIQVVTLGDEEARRRGTQKTVLERKAPPTFNILVEIKSWHHVLVHRDVAETIDNILRGRPVTIEERTRSEDGSIATTTRVVQPPRRVTTRLPWQPATESPWYEPHEAAPSRSNGGPLRAAAARAPLALAPEVPPETERRRTVTIYPFGISRKRLEESGTRLGVPVIITEDLNQADYVVTLKSYYRQRTGPIQDAEEQQVPIFVLRSNAQAQVDQCLAAIFGLDSHTAEPPDTDDALRLTEQAVQEVLSTSRPVDLPPAEAAVRRRQHQMAAQHNLGSRSYGTEPHRWVRIFKR